MWVCAKKRNCKNNEGPKRACTQKNNRSKERNENLLGLMMNTQRSKSTYFGKTTIATLSSSTRNPNTTKFECHLRKHTFLDRLTSNFDFHLSEYMKTSPGNVAFTSRILVFDMDKLKHLYSRSLLT